MLKGLYHVLYYLYVFWWGDVNFVSRFWVEDRFDSFLDENVEFDHELFEKWCFLVDIEVILVDSFSHTL